MVFDGPDGNAVLTVSTRYQYQWKKHVIDYSDCGEVTEFRFYSNCAGVNDRPVYYISFVEVIDLASSLTDNNLADFSSEKYEELMTNYKSDDMSVTYMSEGPDGEQNVLKIDWVAGTSGYFGFILDFDIRKIFKSRYR